VKINANQNNEPNIPGGVKSVFVKLFKKDLNIENPNEAFIGK